MITSVLDEAARREAELRDLSHDGRMALRADIERARAYLTGDGFSAKGAHGLALYACEPAELFDVCACPDPSRPRPSWPTPPSSSPSCPSRSASGSVLLVQPPQRPHPHRDG
ncbi:MAG: hypothetical protein M3P39_04450 [Actinomycetota bacterium]|nr:hypothetical protein [Actinomycetota bacterium]